MSQIHHDGRRINRQQRIAATSTTAMEWLSTSTSTLSTLTCPSSSSWMQEMHIPRITRTNSKIDLISLCSRLSDPHFILPKPFLLPPSSESNVDEYSSAHPHAAATSAFDSTHYVDDDTDNEPEAIISSSHFTSSAPLSPTFTISTHSPSPPNIPSPALDAIHQQKEEEYKQATEEKDRTSPFSNNVSSAMLSNPTSPRPSPRLRWSESSTLVHLDMSTTQEQNNQEEEVEEDKASVNNEEITPFDSTTSISPQCPVLITPQSTKPIELHRTQLPFSEQRHEQRVAALTVPDKVLPCDPQCLSDSSSSPSPRSRILHSPQLSLFQRIQAANEAQEKAIRNISEIIKQQQQQQKLKPTEPKPTPPPKSTQVSTSPSRPITSPIQPATSQPKIHHAQKNKKTEENIGTVQTISYAHFKPTPVIIPIARPASSPFIIATKPSSTTAAATNKVQSKKNEEISKVKKVKAVTPVRVSQPPSAPPSAAVTSLSSSRSPALPLPKAGPLTQPNKAEEKVEGRQTHSTLPKPTPATPASASAPASVQPISSILPVPPVSSPLSASRIQPARAAMQTASKKKKSTAAAAIVPTAPTSINTTSVPTPVLPSTPSSSKRRKRPRISRNVVRTGEFDVLGRKKVVRFTEAQMLKEHFPDLATQLKDLPSRQSRHSRHAQLIDQDTSEEAMLAGQKGKRKAEEDTEMDCEESFLSSVRDLPSKRVRRESALLQGDFVSDLSK